MSSWMSMRRVQQLSVLKCVLLSMPLWYLVMEKGLLMLTKVGWISFLESLSLISNREDATRVDGSSVEVAIVPETAASVRRTCLK